MKYKILFIDTETSGIPNLRASYEQLDKWPHVLQLTAVLREVNVTSEGVTLLDIVDNQNDYITYSGHIDEGAVNVHHLTHQFLQEYGKDVNLVLTKFKQLFDQSDFCCAHNCIFDMKMIKAELLRLVVKGISNMDFHLRSKPWIDTMYHGTKLCQIKTTNGRLKWPRLEELYNYLRLQSLVSVTDTSHLHDAKYDVECLMNCFEGMSGSELFSERHFINIINKHLSKNEVQ